ncbi:MAG: hypothetical protein V1850_02490 [Candidatus Bathyarchaeota archaeon]
MTEYYQLFNIKVPMKIWSEIAKDKQLNARRNLIQANIESANELGSFIECIFYLLERGYILNKNFQFITANVDELHD